MTKKKVKKFSFSIYDKTLLKELFFIKEITNEKKFIQVVYKLLWSAINTYKESQQYKNDLNKFQMIQQRKQELDEEIEDLNDKDRRIKGLIAFVEKYDK